MSFRDDDELPAMAVQEAKLTHQHELAGDVSVAAVGLCRALMRGAAWNRALELAALARQPAIQTALSFASRLPPNSGGANCCPVLVGSIAGERWGGCQIVVDGHRETEILRRSLELSEELASQWLSSRSDG